LQDKKNQGQSPHILESCSEILPSLWICGLRSFHDHCDLKQPECGQCIRTGRQCEGYRLPTDLQTRGQSDEISLKHSHSKRKSTDTVLENNALFQFLQEHLHPVQIRLSGRRDHKDSIPISLNLLPEDGAACFFFNDYVLEEFVFPRNLYDSYHDLQQCLFSKCPLKYNRCFGDGMSFKNVANSCDDKESQLEICSGLELRQFRPEGPG
jgi:hypothetical protein